MKKIIISFLAVLFLIACKSEPTHVVRIEGKQILINDDINSKKSIDDFILPYKEKVEKEMSTVLSFTPIELSRKDGELESSLGNLLADLCYEKANPVFNSRTGKNIDFAMFNYGGIRSTIPQGNITVENAFNLMPFENTLVVAELSSEKIKELINYLLTANIAHPLSKQVSLEITKNGYDFKINHTKIDDSKTYFVLTSDYLQNGGDKMNFFKNPVNLYPLDYKVRNAIIDYFKENDTIKVALDGRFRNAK